jgi:hypothetical protein
MKFQEWDLWMFAWGCLEVTEKVDLIDYYATEWITVVKMFYTIDTRPRWYKTFYVRNLQMFIKKLECLFQEGFSSLV